MTYLATRAYELAEQAYALANSKSGSGGGSSGSIVPEADRSGIASPEGAITGLEKMQEYTQLAADGLTVVTTWKFNGTVGENTGWITFA